MLPLGLFGHKDLDLFGHKETDWQILETVFASTLAGFAKPSKMMVRHSPGGVSHRK
jgi:hypothetical protein